MTIIRGRIEVENHYTMMPNAWARDARLSRRARGLLLELLSHREGWQITVSGLAATGQEGRDSIRSALNELETHGYLIRGRERSEDGTLGAASYTLTDPGEFTYDGFSNVGETNVGESAPKKNIYKKNITKNYPQTPSDPGFDRFWEVYPRRAGKGQARRAWATAIKVADPEVIVAGAERYRDDPTRDPRFTKHPSTWLNGECWTDEVAVVAEVPGGRLWEE